MKHACPSCNNLFEGKNLLGGSQPLFKSYRYCPSCKTKIRVDDATKKRQLFGVFVALADLIFVLLSFKYFYFFPIGLLLFIFIIFFVMYSERKILFVLYPDKENYSDKK